MSDALHGYRRLGRRFVSLIATSKLARTVKSQFVGLSWEPRWFQLHQADLSLSGTNVDPSLAQPRVSMSFFFHLHCFVSVPRPYFLVPFFSIVSRVLHLYLNTPYFHMYVLSRRHRGDRCQRSILTSLTSALPSRASYQSSGNRTTPSKVSPDEHQFTRMSANP